MWTKQQVLQQEQQLRLRLQSGLSGSGAWLEWSRQHLLQQQLRVLQTRQLALLQQQQSLALPQPLQQRLNSSSSALCSMLRQ
jgi:hypothetical protein